MSAFTDALQLLQQETNAPGAGMPPAAPAAAPPASPYTQALGDITKSDEELRAQMGPPATPMSWGDLGRFVMTAGIKGGSGLLNSALDPLAVLRSIVSPDLERVEKSTAPTAPGQSDLPPAVETVLKTGGGILADPGKARADALFNLSGSLGAPEYQPTTPQGRTALSASSGAMAGLPMGPLGALIGGLGGGASQATQEITGSERLANIAGLAPGVLAMGGAIPINAARARIQANPELTQLFDTGVRPTFGEMMGASGTTLGSALNRIEQGITSWPIFGDFQRSGRRSAMDEFNRGKINETLGKFGETLDPQTSSGNAAIAEMQKKTGDFYDNITPHLSLNADPQFLVTDLGNVNAKAGMLRNEQRQVYDNFLEKYVTEPLRKNNGHMDGVTFREAESEIGKEAHSNVHSGNAGDHALGSTLYDLQGALRELQMRSNPEHAQALQNVHDAYADAQRLQKAASYIGADKGNFSPEQLYRAVRDLDPSTEHRMFAGGKARLQDYAQAGKSILGNTVPDSGTAFRGMTLGIPFGASYLAHPAIAATTLGGLLGTWGLYGPGRRRAADFLYNNPQGMPAGLSGLLTNQNYVQP